MAIHFDGERMARAIEAHSLWWRGALDRPLACITIKDAYYVEKKARAPLLSQQSCTQTGWSAEEVIDSIDEELSRREFLGDSFPMVDFAAYGPGVLAALCGATLDNSPGSVWFFPKGKRDIGDIHVKYDPENPWARRIKAIYRAGLEKWGGSVIMGIPDLGGVMDVAATMRGTQSLLMDLYDEPGEVLRLCREVQQAWYEAFDDFSAVLRPQGAWTSWIGLLSEAPAYVLQCDFCYMISNDMFKTFVLPTLQGDVRRLDNCIYHLDGIGELNHLDDILAIPGLKAVQWVHGDGQPGAVHWLDVYRKILSAGKQVTV